MNKINLLEPSGKVAKIKVLLYLTNMKSNFPELLFIALVLSISSCSSKNDFEYDKNKNDYLEAINCLHQNYSAIFTSSTLGNAESLYKQDFEHLKMCENILQLMEMHSIEFVLCYKDSTIAFFETPVTGIKEKQFILMFSNKQEKINDKLTTGIKVVKKYKECYELEKIISLTN